MLGVKEHREGGDDAVRPAFPAQPEPLSPAAQESLRLHQELVGLRHRYPWLVRARPVVEHLANRQLLLRVTDGTSSLLVALNLGEPDTLVLPSQPWHLWPAVARSPATASSWLRTDGACSPQRDVRGSPRCHG